MPRSCCVLGCKSNYYSKNGTLVSIFTFPKEEDIKKKWLTSIRRENFVPTIHSGVCIKHFDSDSVVKEDQFPCADGSFITLPRRRLKLREGAYPTIFKHFPAKRKDPSQLLSKRVSRDKDITGYEFQNQSSSKKKQKRNSRRKRLKPLEEEKEEETKHDINWAEEDISTIHMPEVISKQQNDQISIDGDIGEELMMHEEYDTGERLEGNLMHEEYETEERLEEETYSVPFCRLCASPSEDVISIFQNMNSNCILLEKIHTYLPIMISAEDLLPTTVCMKCINKLEICHNLVQDCLDADVILKTMFGLQNSKQVQDCDKNVAVKHSNISRHTKDTSNNLLEEDYDFMNFTDVKFEVESNADFHDEQVLNQIPDKKTYEQNNDVIQNSNTVDLDMRMAEKTTVLTRIVNKESNLMNIPRKGMKKRKLKFLVVKKNASEGETKEADLQKILQLALNSISYPQYSKSQKTKAREKPQNMPPVDNCCVDSHREISRLNSTEQNFEHVHKKIARDHTYTRKVP